MRRITKETDWTGFAVFYCTIVENLIDIQGRIQDRRTGRAPLFEIFFCKFWLENTYTIFKNFSQHTMCTICILFSVLTTRTCWEASKHYPVLKNNSYRAGTAPWFWNSCFRHWYIREIMLFQKKNMIHTCIISGIKCLISEKDSYKYWQSAVKIQFFIWNFEYVAHLEKTFYCQRIIIDLFEVLRCISNLSAIFRSHLILIFSKYFFPLKKSLKPCLQFCWPYSITITNSKQLFTFFPEHVIEKSVY